MILGLSVGLLVCAVASMCVTASVQAHRSVTDHDPLLEARGSDAEVAVRVDSPPVSSPMRGNLCQYDVRVLALAHLSELRPSQAPARVFASGRACDVVPSAQYVLTVRIREARYGSVPTWLMAGSGEGRMRRVKEPSDVQRLVHRLQHAFVRTCSSLPQTGRILVPGVTIGVLGSQAFPSDGVSVARKDDSAAKGLKRDFKQVGIVHLLAVSGGHFALVADFIRRRCARARMRRVLQSLCVGVSIAGLAVLMFPSDSVLRAVMMGILAAIASAVGRPGQSLPALCWTVCLALVLSPDLASSFGFSLSCAAVLGILLFVRPLAAAFRSLPSCLRESLSVTLSAQALTLPIQLLISPQLSLMSVPANLCVAPFVSFSTVCGLLSLLASWVAPHAGTVLACMAGAGTEAMAAIARFFASLDPLAASSSTVRHILPGSFASSDGLRRAVICVAGEAAACLLVLGTRAAARRVRFEWRTFREEQEERSMSKVATNLEG